MDRYLLAMGWKTVNGTWDKKEIKADLIVISVLSCVVIAAYLY
jgi:hypothetical protein